MWVLSDAQWTAWGAVAVAVISGVVALRSRKTAPYEALASRVTELEDRSARQGDEIAKLRATVNDLMEMLESAEHENERLHEYVQALLVYIGDLAAIIRKLAPAAVIPTIPASPIFPLTSRRER